ncbi:protein GUCD1-like isoform X1 [Strongylocentrotus purpuratus]|uniref:Protein GUCD1 n=1 Tax=Strongylocentrotus purpuratus TaxID=7668 RepID=A0A7M7P7E3_STRPU|nr:protein GUCD1-like isoform X1 [Strongylocentrotus purpuratus]
MGEIIEVQHILQQEEWDCGLACARMIFRYCNISLGEGDTELTRVCKDLEIQKAVWTIDLAHLMSKFNIKHDFYTITFGVDPKYSTVEFYNSNTFEFSGEEFRINNLFQEAKDKGIIASKKSLVRDEIVSRLREGQPAIVLIDASILHCQMCEGTRQQQYLQLGCCHKDREEEERGYIGHFIVACGCNLEKGQIFYKNPARPVDLCCCSFENFDAARKSHGTDEDILFIHR